MIGDVIHFRRYIMCISVTLLVDDIQLCMELHEKIDFPVIPTKNGKMYSQ